MTKILVLGAGKSATDLIEYLLVRSEKYNWKITVGDYNEALAAQKVGNHPNGKAVLFDVHDAAMRSKMVSEADLVASVLPAKFHYLVAEDCLKHGKHIVTPSYVSDKEKQLDEAFRKADLLFMGEIGLDPGIDHMSIMKMLADIKAKGGTVTSVKSFTGALIAPESLGENPWKYKFTWAPMNVILAGQGTAQYLYEGKPKYVPYSRLFSTTSQYDFEDLGTFEGYPNRNSIVYKDKYNIPKVPNLLRGTLRYGGYVQAWDALVQLGLTRNDIRLAHSNQLTYADLVTAFLPANAKGANLQQRLADFLGLSEENATVQKIAWTGLLSDASIPLANATPAEILAELLERKWVLGKQDKDLIVMVHLMDYVVNGEKHRLASRLVIKGKDADHTAIAKTVGVPMAIMVKLLATGKINLTGVHIPLEPQVYLPILEELEEFGIVFQESESKV
ncbi:MAG: saccharopine dehydrogenase C-terminal domain-containing protein [Chitinophagales bacterium]